MSFLDSFSCVHIVGIGGAGVSAIAKFCQAHGKRVSGSDLATSVITDDLMRRSIEVRIGPSEAGWVPENCDLLVYSEAVPDTAPERAEAAKRGIRQLGHFAFHGELSKEFRTICIAGTNGKSTTTAMTGKIFEAAGLDPTVFVGSLVPGWGMGNVRIGKSDLLIIEGDEYKRKVLELHPETTLITNIEEDHLEIYKDLADIEAMFHQLVEQTSKTVFINWFDQHHPIACGEEQAEIRSFGEDFAKKGLVARLLKQTYKARTIKDGMQTLHLEAAGDLTLRVPGAFNMLNALGALAIAEVYDVHFETAQKALLDFTGIWRRFERVGVSNGAEIISDYAHHPTAIKGTLEAAREFYPGRRIVVLFEPHQHKRTKELFDDFAVSFGGADVLILSAIYGVAGRTTDTDVSSEQLLHAAMTSDAAPKQGMYAANLEEAEMKMRDLIREGDVVLVMGAGNVDRVARSLVADGVGMASSSPSLPRRG